MTEKKENILNAALELFAKEGFKPTSTSKVAKRAGVSEGLIFRHFKNKEGLLEAIVQMGEERAKVLFADIVMEADPKSVIRKTLSLKDKMSKNSPEGVFWKLQFKIKWELEIYGEHKMEALQNALSSAFDKLGAQDPEQEAQTLLITLDGLATRYYLQENFDIDGAVEFLMKKYEV